MSFQEIKRLISFSLVLLLFQFSAQAQTHQHTIVEGGYNPAALPPVFNAANAVDWTPLPDAIEPRVEGHSAVLNNKIYFFGGFQTQDIVPTDQNEIYDLSTNSWSTFTPLPVPNTHVGTAEADGKVWIAGGFALIGFIQTVDLVWIYDPVANTFTDGPSLPAPRAGGALVRLGRKLHYISGLINRNDNTGDHFVLDLDEPGGPQTWTMAAPMPDPRDHFSAIAVGGKIYAIGGQFGHDIDPVDTNLMHVYDPVTDSWERKADLPYIRSHFEPGTVVVDGKIIIAGGRTGTQNCVDDITQYDPATNTWTELFDMPYCALAPSAKVIGEELYVSHGGVVSVLFPTNEANKTDFERSVGPTMSFTPTTYSTLMAPNETETIEPLLWTLSDEANYTISLAGLPSWISSVSKSAGVADAAADEIDIQLNTAGLSPGTYSHTLTATASGYNNATLTIEVTVSGNDNINSQVLAEGWNMVSLPVSPSNADAAIVYDDVPNITLPIAFDGSAYAAQQTLAMGNGYWLKLDANATQVHNGTTQNTLAVSLLDGWNMVGGASCYSELNDVTGATGILPATIYGFDPSLGYEATTVLEPGRGYWLKADGAGTVTFNCPAGKASGATSGLQHAAEASVSRLYITDATGQMRMLYLGDAGADTETYKLPPIPPQTIVDARFHTGLSIMTEAQAVIKLQAMSAPLTLTFDGDANDVLDLLIKDSDGWRTVGHLSSDQPVTLDIADLDRLQISKREAEDLITPNEFALQSAYPNPFQTELTVAFDAPAAGVAYVAVYDLLGKRVLETSRQAIDAGSHTIQLDGTNLASGSYVYRLVVETPESTQTAFGRAVRLK